MRALLLSAGKCFSHARPKPLERPVNSPSKNGLIFQPAASKSSCQEAKLPLLPPLFEMLRRLRFEVGNDPTIRVQQLRHAGFDFRNGLVRLTDS